MRVTNEQANKIYTTSCNFRDQITGITTRELSADLLEARELIKEMSQTLLMISKYPIAFVCEDVRTLARNEWEKSKEYV